jgi:hypothetical protein
VSTAFLFFSFFVSFFSSSGSRFAFTSANERKMIVLAIFQAQVLRA